MSEPSELHVTVHCPPVATIASGDARADERTFADLTSRHRRELHVHCYRMLSSFDDAEDAVQETFLRAWRSRDRLEGEVQYRPWLYRIATNVCLDLLRARGRRAVHVRSFAEVPWLQPYPDPLLDELAPRDDEPDAAVVRRETIELTFIAALQALPPRQRAALTRRSWRSSRAACTTRQTWNSRWRPRSTAGSPG